MGPRQPFALGFVPGIRPAEGSSSDIARPAQVITTTTRLGKAFGLDLHALLTNPNPIHIINQNMN